MHVCVDMGGLLRMVADCCVLLYRRRPPTMCSPRTWMLHRRASAQLCPRPEAPMYCVTGSSPAQLPPSSPRSMSGRDLRNCRAASPVHQTYANTSQFGSLLHSYSMSFAAGRPHVAVDDPARGRGPLSQFTSGRVGVTTSHSLLFPVARFPSSTPARAARLAPLHTVMSAVRLLHQIDRRLI